MWFNLLKNEFSWGMLDASGIKEYVGFGCITEDQYNQIVTSNK